MSRPHKVLAMVILLESIVLAVLSLQSGWRRRPPEVNLSLLDVETAGAIRQLEDRVAKRPDDPEAWMDLAREYHAFGFFRAADYCYRVMDDLRPEEKSYLYFWGATLARIGELDEAASRFERALRAGVDQVGPYAWLSIGKCRLRAGQDEAAEKALRHSPALPEARFLLARMLIRDGRTEEALTVLDQLSQEVPATIQIEMMKSWAAEELGRDDDAWEHRQRSLHRSLQFLRTEPVALDDKRRRERAGPVARHERSRKLAEQGQTARAIAVSQELLKTTWEEPFARHLAELELRAGKVQQSISRLQSIERRVGPSAERLLELGRAWSLLKDHDKARAAWVRALRFKPLPDVHAELAKSYQAAGDDRNASRHRALEQFEIGQEHWLADRLKEALKSFEAALRISGEEARIWYYLGNTRQHLGDGSGAEAAYRRCLTLDPHHGRALRELLRAQGE